MRDDQLDDKRGDWIHRGGKDRQMIVSSSPIPASLRKAELTSEGRDQCGEQPWPAFETGLDCQIVVLGVRLSPQLSALLHRATQEKSLGWTVVVLRWISCFVEP